MDAKELENYKKSLLEQRNQLVGQVNNNNRQTFDLARDDMQDPVDMAVSDREQTIMLSINESERTLLDQIDEALQRIEFSTYGDCTNCGNEISEARLKAVPYARYCMNCQDLLERGLLDEVEAA
jgi:DnaK suppressor protein